MKVRINPKKSLAKKNPKKEEPALQTPAPPTIAELYPEIPEGEYFIGIDNGVSGTIGIRGPEGYAVQHKMPVKKELDYTKKKQWLNRIDILGLRKILFPYQRRPHKVYIERPMLNPKRWRASCSALRGHETVLIALEDFKMRHEYVDSKNWQSVMLPKNLAKGETKSASLAVGKRLFPKLELKPDADGLLIAEWASRKP